MRKILLACLFVFSAFSMIKADPPNPSTAVIKNFVIDAVNGNFQMQMIVNGGAYNYVSFDVSAPKTKALMATALAAYTNGLPVSIYYSGSLNGYWIITNMTLGQL